MDEDPEHCMSRHGTRAVKDLERSLRPTAQLRITVDAASHSFRPLKRVLQLVWVSKTCLGNRFWLKLHSFKSKGGTLDKPADGGG